MKRSGPKNIVASVLSDLLNIFLFNTEKVTALAETLEHPETRTEAAEAIRGLIDAIVLTPTEAALAAPTSVSAGRPRPAQTLQPPVRATFRLR